MTCQVNMRIFMSDFSDSNNAKRHKLDERLAAQDDRVSAGRSSTVYPASQDTSEAWLHLGLCTNELLDLDPQAAEDSEVMCLLIIEIRLL